MRRSIRFQFSLIFIAIMTGMIALCLAANSLLLRPYYMKKKTDALREAYRSINAAAVRGEIFTSDVDIYLQQICAKFDIEFLVLDSDSQMVKTSANEPEWMARQLWNNILGISTPEIVVGVVEKTLLKAFACEGFDLSYSLNGVLDICIYISHMRAYFT